LSPHHLQHGWQTMTELLMSTILEPCFIRDLILSSRLLSAKGRVPLRCHSAQTAAAMKWGQAETESDDASLRTLRSVQAVVTIGFGLIRL